MRPFSRRNSSDGALRSSDSAWCQSSSKVWLKSVEHLAPVHAKKLLTYLRLCDLRLGLLINFGARVIKDGIKRVVDGLWSRELN
jgi:hypothetical protein